MADTNIEKRGTDGPLCKSWSVKDKANMPRINTQQTVVIKCGIKLRPNHCNTEILEGDENLKQYSLTPLGESPSLEANAPSVYIFPTFMSCEGSVPCSQKLVSDPYPQRREYT
jgi:hypothetical protein